MKREVATDDQAKTAEAQRRIFAEAMQQRLSEANLSISAISSRLANFCGRSCSHCCYHIFALSRAEATAITAYLLAHDSQRQAFLANSAALDRDYPDRWQLRQELSTPERELEYFARKIPCDFLDQNGDCLVYPVRPLNCSAYISYASARICAMEPKGHIPPEAQKTFIEQRSWFEGRSRSRYPGEPATSYVWPAIVRDNLLHGNY